jgi:hypothetical protein
MRSDTGTNPTLRSPEIWLAAAELDALGAASHAAALAAHRALDAALALIGALPRTVERERIAEPVRRALMCAYAAMDSSASAAAHVDGLIEGARLVALAAEAARCADDLGTRRQELGGHLAIAHAALAAGAQSIVRETGGGTA